jgi:hypothetical protein
MKRVSRIINILLIEVVTYSLFTLMYRPFDPLVFLIWMVGPLVFFEVVVRIKFTYILALIVLLGGNLIVVPMIMDLIDNLATEYPSSADSITLLRYTTIFAPFLVTVRILLPEFFARHKQNDLGRRSPISYSSDQTYSTSSDDNHHDFDPNDLDPAYIESHANAWDRWHGFGMPEKEEDKDE